MTTYKITFQTKDITSNFVAIVSRWRIICANTSDEALKQLNSLYNNIIGDILISVVS